jgi:hypothetical protein
MASSKIKYSVEIPLKCPAHILYEFISTVNGLNEWFAERVEQEDNEFSFYWGGEPEHALMLEKKDDVLAKYRWDHQAKDEYFEFRIDRNDVTSGTVLIVTDFAEKNDLKDQQLLWETQLNDLKHRLGA